jgi:hypothetical protein
MLVVVTWSAVFVVIAVSFALGHPLIPDPALRRIDDWANADWTRTRAALLVASILGAYFLMIAVHESGHVLGGRLVGFRFQSIRVGPVMVDRPFRLSLYAGPGALINGVAVTLPVTTDRLARRAIGMVLAGPAANLVSGLVLLLLPVHKGLFAGLFITFSLANGFSDLLPFEGRLGVSDGRRLGMLLRGGERGERWLAVMKLSAELAAGASPAAVSPDFLAKAIAVRDDSADTVSGYAFAFTAALYQHDIARAGQLLEVCLAYAGFAGAAMREALVSDTAVFTAKRLQRPDLARLWLADLPSNAQRPWLRSRVEVAILGAEGDRAGALRKLDDLEASLLKLPNATQRRLLSQQLPQWRAELGRDSG